MLIKIFSLLSLASVALAQSADAATVGLQALLEKTPELNSLYTVIWKNPVLVRNLVEAKNVTIFAPNNQAFAKFQDPLLDGDLTAILSYHIIAGTYESSALKTVPAFLPTTLENYDKYRNLTKPQVVKALIEKDKAVVYGGLNKFVTVVKAVGLPVPRLSSAC